MNDSALSFRAKIEHGCLMIEDVESDDDLSEWDPSSTNWHKEESSIIFSVLPASEGWVMCEIWQQAPEQAMPVQLFDEVIRSDAGRLMVHDPNDDVRIRFRVNGEQVRVVALADEADFASTVQLILGDATDSV